MERRTFLKTGAAAGISAGAMTVGAVPAEAASSPRVGRPMKDKTSLAGSLLDLTTPAGNREAWARLLGNTDMKSTKYGWAQGIVQGVRPGEAVRDLCGFTMLSCAKLIPLARARRDLATARCCGRSASTPT
jgi:hypothetical protein